MLLRTLMSAAPIALMLAATPVVAAVPKPGPDAELSKLFHDSDEGHLRRNPLEALYRGDMRYADQLGDMISDRYYAAERAAAEDDLKRLARIDRARLTPTDRIAYDVFRWQQATALKLLQPDILALTAVRPLDHFLGLQVSYPAVASGEGAAPFKTVADYENNLKRNDRYAAIMDAAIGRFREGMKTGIVQPKIVVRNMIAQLDTQLAQGIEGSTFYGPVAKFPAGVSAADQARLKAAYAAMIRDRIRPAYTRLRDFLRDEYLPVARDAVGLSAMKGGEKLYRLSIEEMTTLPLDPEEVHRLGLSEVARIKGEMETIRRQVGFQGTLAQFFEHIRTDPQFVPPSKAWLRDAYTAIGKRVAAHVPEQFALLPKAPLEIRPVEEYREKTEAGGSYQSGTPDGSRPGIFYFNGYDLPSRTTPGMESLYLHEAIPGHHFQISIAQEDQSLPAFMRFGGNTAYVEGWALYAESLWKEFGLETDPFQRFGGLDDEMMRAMRLVVDTGIHAKGWSREQAIAYMLANSGMGRTDATSEVERYIAWPGQALAYKIGALTILKLKARAMAALGAKFDPRAFHAQVLDTGALPMTVLEEKIDAWIETSRAGH